MSRPGLHRVVVEVESRTLRSGLVIPTAIVWPDGRRFEVDRVVQMQKSRLHGPDGTPWAYRVAIGRHVRDLWHIPPRWEVACGKPGSHVWSGAPEVDFAEAHRLYGLRC